MHIRLVLDRDADLGHKLLRIACNAVVNERDLTGKANDLHFVLVNIVEQLLVLRRHLCVTAPKAQPQHDLRRPGVYPRRHAVEKCCVAVGNGLQSFIFQRVKHFHGGGITGVAAPRKKIEGGAP